MGYCKGASYNRVVQMNQLGSEHVSRGDKLLIVKQMGTGA